MESKDGEKAGAKLFDAAAEACKRDTKSALCDLLKTAHARNVALDINHLLFVAAGAGSADCARHLLRVGADPNYVRPVLNRADVHSKGHTPLDAACREGSGIVAEMLLAAGADPNHCASKWGMLAIQFCALGDWTYGRSNCMKYLLKYRANIDALDEIGCTALWLASWCGTYESVKTLLKAGADPNKIAPLYGTPLMAAAERSEAFSYKIVEILLQHGANVMLLNYGALRMAVKCRSKARVQLLLAAAEMIEDPFGDIPDDIMDEIKALDAKRAKRAKRDVPKKAGFEVVTPELTPASQVAALPSSRS